MSQDRTDATETVLKPLGPGRVKRMAAGLGWKSDGHTVERQFTLESRDLAVQFIAWFGRCLKRTKLDVKIAQKGGQVDLALIDSGEGFTSSDMRMVRQITMRYINPPSP